MLYWLPGTEEFPYWFLYHFPHTFTPLPFPKEKTQVHNGMQLHEHVDFIKVC